MVLARAIASWTRSAAMLAGVVRDSDTASPLEPRATKTPYAVFVFPDDSTETFYYRDQVEVTYTSDASSSYMVVNCNQGVGDVMQNQVAPGGNATVGVTLQLADGDSYSDSSDLNCWFQLRNSSGYAQYAVGTNSEAWNYIHTTRSGGPATFAISSSTSSATSSTKTSTSTTSATSAATSKANSAATTTSSSSSSNESNVSAASDGAQPTVTSASSTATSSTSSSSKGISGTVGVAIGVSIGALAVIVPLAIWAFVHRQRKQRRLEEVRRRLQTGSDMPPGTGPHQYFGPNPNAVEVAASGPDTMYGYYTSKDQPLTASSMKTSSMTTINTRSPVSELYPGVGGTGTEVHQHSGEVYELYGTGEAQHFNTNSPGYGHQAAQNPPGELESLRRTVELASGGNGRGKGGL